MKIYIKTENGCYLTGFSSIDGPLWASRDETDESNFEEFESREEAEGTLQTVEEWGDTAEIVEE